MFKVESGSAHTVSYFQGEMTFKLATGWLIQKINKLITQNLCVLLCT